MDVKSVFLKGYINKEVYVSQPPDFEDHKNMDYIFKLRRAIYGLKQVLWAYYERLSRFLNKQGFNFGKVDTTLFIRHKAKHIILVQIYVNLILYLGLLMNLFARVFLVWCVVNMWCL